MARSKTEWDNSTAEYIWEKLAVMDMALGGLKGASGNGVEWKVRALRKQNAELMDYLEVNHLGGIRGWLSA